MKRLVVIVCILCACVGARAQYFNMSEDSLAVWMNQQKGEKLIKQGRGWFIAGGTTAAIGGGLMALPFIDMARRGTNPDFAENMLYTITLGYGMCFAVVGLGTALVGVPLTVAGNGIKHSDTLWKDLRYDDPGQRGFGVILDASTLLYWIQLKATAGYHFNKNFFLGGGVGSTWDFHAYNDIWGNYLPCLPLYAEMRYSMLNRFCSPYIGLSAGYDIIDGGPYMGADLGLRIRMSPTSPKSFWVSATAEVAGYMHAGVKMGWSF